jgi:hypothetical protein
VVTAVKEAVALAVQEAVRGVLTELLTNPELLRTVFQAAAPQTSPAPEPVSRAARVSAGDRLKTKVRCLGSRVQTWLHGARSFAGPHLAMVIAWVGGFTTTLAVRAGLALRRLGASLAQA